MFRPRFGLMLGPPRLQPNDAAGPRQLVGELMVFGVAFTVLRKKLKETDSDVGTDIIFAVKVIRFGNIRF